jgi:hypothetical protein
MEDDLDEVTANVTILIRAELEVQHRLGDHAVPVSGCPVCDAHQAA